MAAAKKPTPELQTLMFAGAGEWESWLAANHASSSGLWVRMAKKGSDLESARYPELVEAALCWGWIDGQAKSENESTYIQRFAPRAKRSVWSKINRTKALKLIEEGRMRPPGMEEVERARGDGRWEAAYDSPATAEPPPDLVAALARNKRARAAFGKLDSRNRYAILYRLQTVKRAETRARKVEAFVAMLAQGGKLYP